MKKSLGSKTLAIIGSVLIGGSGLAMAQLSITDSATAPTSNLVISQPNFSGSLSGNTDYSDNNGAPAESFTAPVNFSLDAVTVKGGSSEGNGANGSNFTITLGTVTNVTDPFNGLTVPQVTVIDKETASLTYANGGDYLTFNLSAPISLTAGTVYSYSVYNDTGYFGFAESTGQPYSGGSAFNEGLTSRSTTSVGSIDALNPGGYYDYNRTFFIEGTTVAVPEPSSLALIVLSATVLLLIQRVRRA